MRRNKHSLSHYRLLTCDMGKLVPVSCLEVLPGDTLQQSSAALIRVSPLLAPVMHAVSVRIHHWFVPNRLLWSGWEDFITGGPDGLGGSAGAYPIINSPASTGFTEGSLADYLGVPPGVPDLPCCAMPFRAYNLIFNENYRDEDLTAEVAADGVTLLNCSWEKDYFTSARPWAQKGPVVTLPLGASAPIVGIGKVTGTYPNANVTVNEAGGRDRTYASAAQFSFNTPDHEVYVEQDVSFPGSPGIYADLSAATATNVNAVRRAFALQRYQEARARYGSRYTEYLRYLGIRSSDARLQRPEYLGGGKQTIAFSEVLKTGAGEDPAEPIGALKGHGIAGVRSRRYRRFFEEHGYVLSLMSVRPRTIYGQGLHRSWRRRTKEDYYQRELEMIGQQEVRTAEIYAQNTAPLNDAIFGYQDRYREYKEHPSTVHAEFRTLLDYWHLGRVFASPPVLNSAFVTCDPSKRIHAEQTQHVLWCMVSNSVQARRMVSRSNASRVI